MTLAEMQARSYQQAVDAGWHTKEIPVPEQVALICSEACEALECYRDKEPISWEQDDGKELPKPMGIASEFADILIRVGHYATLNGIDLTAEVEKKLKFNALRGFRHGGKAC